MIALLGVSKLGDRGGDGEWSQDGEEEELGMHDGRLVDIDRVFPSED